MLNIDLIDNLYAGLTKEQQQSLCELLFKKSKQNMNYFRRTKDISLSKSETLADFFHMPLDYLREGCSFRANNVSGNNNTVGNVSVNTIPNMSRKIQSHYSLYYRGNWFEEYSFRGYVESLAEGADVQNLGGWLFDRQDFNGKMPWQLPYNYENEY